jgi:hypothetical protein
MIVSLGPLLINNFNMQVQKLLLLTVCLTGETLFAQDLSYSKPGKTYYRELPDPAITLNEEWSKLSNAVTVSFVSDNIRFPKKSVPSVSHQMNWEATAWKGEKVHTQILVWTTELIPKLGFTVSDLMDEKGNRIDNKNITPGFLRYVMTDEFGKGCDSRKGTDYDSSLVADPIDIIKTIPVQPNTVQPVWLSVQVPRDIPAGKYTGTITINATKKYKLRISINVLSQLLPPPGQWKFDLDLWQCPPAIAKVHDVKLWSNEHFDLMKPYYKLLAGAGQKTITAYIIKQPWGSVQVNNEYPGFIQWIKKRDGTWIYDYSLFDRYISMVMSCGIDQHINCYSMITWDLSFIYYDEALGKETSIQAKPGSSEYYEYWSPMLKDFTNHLKEKGWFDMTAIAMDERPLESMRSVIALLKQIDPNWKIALAGSYHEEIEKDIYDYCLIIKRMFPETVLNQRKALGKPSTFYTACGEKHPNGFTFSPPAENAWMGWYAAAAGLTGYLRWAYNNWVKNPLLDSRFRTWPAGDTYQIYPGPRTSVRFEKYIEGIQDFEKIRLLKEQFAKEGDKERLSELNGMLAPFKPENLEKTSAADMVVKAKEILNKY